jgi:DNA-binding FadR family transcriptional regulator
MLALQPLRAASLKDVFIERFEELILSGKLSIGQRLPPERVLAQQLGVSRPVVHEGLVELAARGLVTMKPRVGTVVSDYRREGSLTLLDSLVSYGKGRLAPELLEDLLALRRLLETETARLAARHRTAADLKELRAISAREAEQPDELDLVVELDFRFHHLVALASGNRLYPMLVKSFEPAHNNLAKQFFARKTVVPRVFALHEQIVDAIATRDENRAGTTMARLLEHGRTVLKKNRAGNGPKRKRKRT